MELPITINNFKISLLPVALIKYFLCRDNYMQRHRISLYDFSFFKSNFLLYHNLWDTKDSKKHTNCKNWEFCHIEMVLGADPA